VGGVRVKIDGLIKGIQGMELLPRNWYQNFYDFDGVALFFVLGLLTLFLLVKNKPRSGLSVSAVISFVVAVLLALVSFTSVYFGDWLLAAYNFLSIALITQLLYSFPRLRPVFVALLGLSFAYLLLAQFLNWGVEKWLLIDVALLLVTVSENVYAKVAGFIIAVVVAPDFVKLFIALLGFYYAFSSLDKKVAIGVALAIGLGFAFTFSLPNFTYEVYWISNFYAKLKQIPFGAQHERFYDESWFVKNVRNTAANSVYKDFVRFLGEDYAKKIGKQVRDTSEVVPSFVKLGWMFGYLSILVVGAYLFFSRGFFEGVVVFLFLVAAPMTPAVSSLLFAYILSVASVDLPVEKKKVKVFLGVVATVVLLATFPIYLSYNSLRDSRYFSNPDFAQNVWKQWHYSVAKKQYLRLLALKIPEKIMNLEDKDLNEKEAKCIALMLNNEWASAEVVAKELLKVDQFNPYANVAIGVAKLNRKDKSGFVNVQNAYLTYPYNRETMYWMAKILATQPDAASKRKALRMFKEFLNWHCWAWDSANYYNALLIEKWKGLLNKNDHKPQKALNGSTASKK